MPRGKKNTTETVQAESETVTPTPKKTVKKVVKKRSPKKTKKTTKTETAAADTPAATATPAPAPVDAKPVDTKPAAPVQPTTLDKIDALLVVLSGLSKTLREVTTEVRNLKKVHNRELREANKGKRKKKEQDPNKPPRKPSGITAPARMTAELCDFLGVSHDTMLPRPQVTKRINQYVKTNGLANKTKGKGTEINPDAALGGLLNVPDDVQLTYFNLQKYLKNHFLKKDAVQATA